MNAIHNVSGIAFGHFGVLALDTNVFMWGVVANTLHSPKVMAVGCYRPRLLEQTAKGGRDLAAKVVATTIKFIPFESKFGHEFLDFRFMPICAVAGPFNGHSAAAAKAIPRHDNKVLPQLIKYTPMFSNHAPGSRPSMPIHMLVRRTTGTWNRSK